MDLNFRYYCIVVMGNVDGVKDEIIKVSDSKPRYMDAKGLLISTFRCVSSPSELQDYFKLNKRSFLIFDTAKECSGFYINGIDKNGQNIDVELFDYIRNGGAKLKDDSEKLAETIKQDSSGFTYSQKTKVKKEPKVDFDVSELTKDEKQERINNILEKGVENFTERDKKMLEILSKQPK